MPRPARKLILVTIPASFTAVLIAMLGIEVWVRTTWDHQRGTPGFFLSDASRGQRLAAGYDGWFAGVPVRTNSLGFRDPREYAIDKPPGTFRVIVIGDSVTFGHGAVYEATYPFLLEQRLQRWRSDVRWEVWNLGVPGYNTRQELTLLKEIGPRIQPDLVVVGFYPNDLTGNESAGEPNFMRRAASAVIRAVQQHLYSFEFYKRAYLTAKWNLASDDDDRQRLQHLAIESDLLSAAGSVADHPDQALSDPEYFDDQQVRDFVCIGVPRVDPNSPGELRGRIEARVSELAPWLDAVRELQQLARAGTYRVVFFVNAAPEICRGQDRFYDGGSLADDAAVVDVLNDGTPAVSSARAFLHYRPSQMPFANGHSIGNSNRVKADVLFDFLRQSVLTPLFPQSQRTH
jgi:hypothetical protein